MSPLPSYNALTASAQIVAPKPRLTPKYDSWQDQIWSYYDQIGEFEYAISWLANTLSRVRLLAAELSPAGDEPIPIETGPAAEAIARLAGGTGGQAQLMKEFAVHLSVPGEGWLVGEVLSEQITEADQAVFAGFTGYETWSVKSADEIRVSRQRVNGQATYDVSEGDSATAWRQISPESLVVRFWDPHPRWGWKADSAARHAIGALTELDLVNKRIIATIISRLASNGILLYDKGRLSFPDAAQQPEGANVDDPFAQMLVEVASRGIKDPTSAEATIPIPLGFELGGDIANVRPDVLMQHIKFDNALDQRLLEERDSSIRRLATSLDMPAEILLGLGQSNHWTAWQIEESGLKTHISPKAELICYSLTTGYLVPMMKAAGEQLIGPNGGRIVVWYDPSEITVRPDRSANVIQAYDRLEVSGETLRREIGVDEDDAPDKAELKEMIIKRMAYNPLYAQSALALLDGQTPPPIEAPRVEESTIELENPDAVDRALPETRDQEVPPPDPDFSAAAAYLSNGKVNVH